MRSALRTTVVAAALVASVPALATGNLECEDVDGAGAWASILITRAGGHMFMPLRADFGAGEEAWSTEDRPGARKVFRAHAYGDARTIVAEFTDQGLAGPVVSLRLAAGSAGRDEVIAGVLVIEDAGAWVVRCEIG